MAFFQALCLWLKNTQIKYDWKTLINNRYLLCLKSAWKFDKNTHLINWLDIFNTYSKIQHVDINVFEIFLVFFLLLSNIKRSKRLASYLSKITSPDMLHVFALCLRRGDTYPRSNFFRTYVSRIKNQIDENSIRRKSRKYNLWI